MILEPGDDVLVIARIEISTPPQYVVNIGGHNVQISDDDLAHFNGQPITRHPI